METALEVGIIISAGQIAVNHAVLGRRGVDKLSIACVDANMRAGFAGVSAGIVKEH